MTAGLHDMLAPACCGLTAFVGMGNTDRADDGAGVVLAHLLRDAGVPHVFDGGASPERILPCVRDGGYDSIVFLDAADLGAAPGTVCVLDTHEITARYPQVSTHKMSVATLARLAGEGNNASLWLIGIQPQSIEMNRQGLSEPVATTIHILAQAITQAISAVGCGLEEQLCN